MRSFRRLLAAFFLATVLSKSAELRGSKLSCGKDHLIHNCASVLVPPITLRQTTYIRSPVTQVISNQIVHNAMLTTTNNVVGTSRVWFQFKRLRSQKGTQRAGRGVIIEIPVRLMKPVTKEEKKWPIHLSQ